MSTRDGTHRRTERIVDDLRMHYEIHGRGRPLIPLHGASMTIGMMGPLLSGLAANRQVAAVEQQGHGRTADVDRPLSYEQMADDTAALMRHLEIDEADLVGYSMGGGIALQLDLAGPCGSEALPPRHMRDEIASPSSRGINHLR